MTETPRETYGNTALYNVALILVFFGVCLVGILHHEMWRDEVYTWTIATNSHSLSDLWANRVQEGHPITWLCAVFLLSQFTQNPFWMQMLHVTLATISVSIFIFYAPFGRLPKTLFTLSYFPLIEYGIITRNYGLGVLFAFAFCAACRRPGKLVAFLFLCCMVNSNIYGAMTAMALATIPVLQAWMGRDKQARGVRTDLLAGMAAFFVATCLSFYQMKPPASTGIQVDWSRLLDLRRVISSFTSVWNAYLPIPDVLSGSFWNVNIWQRLYAMWGSPVVLVVVFTAFLILATTLTCLSRAPFVIPCYVLGNLGILAFIILFGPGQLRHHGHLFLLFVACCWIAEQARSGTNGRWRGGRVTLASWIQNHRRKLVTIVFGIHCAAGLYALDQDILRPWSCVQEAAVWIDKHAGQRAIAVYPDFLGNGIHAFAGERKLFFLEMNRWGTIGFLDLRKREKTTCEIMMARLAELLEQREEGVLLACTEQVTCVKQGLELRLVRSFEGCIRDDERVYLYICRLRK